nr:serine/threonine-protein phosphatase 7 long form homolog isoform X4 [Arachis hypogaea]
MPKKNKTRDVDRPELHIMHYLSHSDYKLRMLTCEHPVPPDRYNDRVEEQLRLTGFYHASQIGVVQCQKALVNALIERWHPDTHTFHLPIGECAVTLEDVALILGLPTDGLPVTGMTLSSFEALEAECLHQFGVAPRKSECRGSCIKLSWLRDLKENLPLTDEVGIQRYVKCHIMLLIGTILFGDKSGAAGVHWKFLPLLREFGSIIQYSWGSACLAHLYRALCRASRVDCKGIDGPLTLLLGWAWMRLPYLSPVPREPRSFPLANRWRNWERGDRRYRYMKLADFRKAFDELQEGEFVWVAYAVDRVDPNIIPAEIYMHSVVWSATVPLVSFECIEWHATDRYRRQFRLVQGVPEEVRNLDKAHGEVLTGPKNFNWATAPTHYMWVMHWTNRYHHVLSELPIPSQPQLETYMHWYRGEYGNRLCLSNLVGEEDDEGNQDLDGGNHDMDEGSQDMDDDNDEQEPHSPEVPPTNPLPQEQPQFSGQYVPQSHFNPSFTHHQQHWVSNGANKETNTLDDDNNVPTQMNQSSAMMIKRKIYHRWLKIALYAAFVLLGQSAATLLGRLYYEKGYGLVLSLQQLAFKKVLKGETFKVVMDVIIYQSIVATIATLIGLFASGEWKGLNEEMRGYEMGEVSYVLNLTFTAIIWQLFSIGCVGLIFEVSSLFSNSISVLGVPIVPLLAVIVFKDKMHGIKAISMVLALWGFISYVYQHYVDERNHNSQNSSNGHDAKASSSPLEEKANR